MRRLLTLLTLALTLPALAQQSHKPSAAHSVPAPTFLMLSDIHFDPFHDPAKAPALASAPVSQWNSILSSPASLNAKEDFASLQSSCKAKGVDTPYDLLQSSITAMQSSATPTFITISGDLIAHKFDCRFKTIFPHSTDADFLSFVDKTIRYSLSRIHAAFPAAIIYLTLGNNDSACGDYMMDPNSPFLKLTGDTTAAGLPAADRVAVLASHSAYGEYNVALPSAIPNARIIAFDDIFQADRYTGCGSKPNPEAAAAQILWLQQQLDAARAAHQRVWLLSHIPPGVNSYSTFAKAGKLCTGGGNPVLYTGDEKLTTLISQYADVIKLGLFGHSHMDEMRFIPAARSTIDPTPIGVPIKIASSISPVDGNNPSFTIATVDPATATLSDYTVYAASNQTGHNTAWTSEYTYSTTFSQPDFSAATLQTLTASFLGDTTGSLSISQAYMQHYFIGIDGKVLAPLWHFYSCSVSNPTAAAFTSCACAAGAPIPTTFVNPKK